MFVLLGLLFALVFTQNFLVMVLPWLAVGGLVGFMMLRVKQQKVLEARANRLQELLLMREHKQVLREVWLLIPELSQQPSLHVRMVNALAHALIELKCYEAGVAAMGYLIEVVPNGHPHAVQIKINRAIAWLMMDHLSDADDALRGMRGLEDEQKQNTIAASYGFASLLQAVKTFHWEDGVEAGPTGQSQQWIDRLRPLGIEAGYGYGLIAFCHLKYGERMVQQDATGGAEGARLHGVAADRWWARATCLLRPDYLLHKFPELTEVAQRQGVRA